MEISKVSLVTAGFSRRPIGVGGGRFARNECPSVRQIARRRRTIIRSKPLWSIRCAHTEEPRVSFELYRRTDTRISNGRDFFEDLLFSRRVRAIRFHIIRVITSTLFTVARADFDKSLGNDGHARQTNRDRARGFGVVISLRDKNRRRFRPRNRRSRLSSPIIYGRR